MSEDPQTPPKRQRSRATGEVRTGKAREREGRLAEGNRRCPSAPLDPFLSTEVHDLSDRRDDDQAPRPGVAEAPVEFRDVPEVLAVEADDERGEEQDRGDCRES